MMIVLLSLYVGLLRIVGSQGAYLTINQAGFHHNALLYVHQTYSPDQLSMWLTGSFQPRQSSRVLFDTVTILSQHTDSGASTEYSTNKQDWLWFLENKLSGPHGILNNLTQSLAGLELRQEKLQIIVMLPYVDPVGQTNFSPELNLSVQNHRRQAIEWYVDRIIQEFESYSNLYLWGIYLMREDIIPGINEQVILETSNIVHSRNLRLLWIPYTSALNWQNWAKLGIDAAILQPGYAFAAPLLQGSFNGGRLRATAQLACQYGLGVEIEINQGAITDYDTDILQDYLAEGSIHGYQQAPTAYFLGSYQTIAQSERACSLIRNYTANTNIQPTFIYDVQWNWIQYNSTMLKASISLPLSSNSSPQGIRIQWSPNNSYWQGRILVEGDIYENNRSQRLVLNSVEVGEKNWRDEHWTSTWLPFLSLNRNRTITSLHMSFIGISLPASLSDKDIIIERIPGAIALQTSTGAPYRIEPSMLPSSGTTVQYGDSTTKTYFSFNRGLLTDGQWSSSQWQSQFSVGWLDPTNHRRYIHILLDFTHATYIDQLLIRMHGGSAAGINWPNTARLLISNDCIPLSSRSSSDCNVISYASTDRIITGGTFTDQGGYLSFNLSTYFRWATIELLPNAWLMIDEIQAFAKGSDLSHDLTYRLLTLPYQSPSDTVANYMDDGIRLTDGLITGMMGPITGWQKSQPRAIVIDLLSNRIIRQASIWVLEKLDWAIKSPTTVIVSVSVDEQEWTLLGGHGQLQMDESLYEARRLFLITDTQYHARYVKFDFPADPFIPGWWTMVSELTASD